MLVNVLSFVAHILSARSTLGARQALTIGTECADYPLKINMMGAEVCNNNNNISRDEAKIIRTLQMMLVGASSLDLNLQV